MEKAASTVELTNNVALNALYVVMMFISIGAPALIALQATLGLIEPPTTAFGFQVITLIFSILGVLILKYLKDKEGRSQAALKFITIGSLTLFLVVLLYYIVTGFSWPAVIQLAVIMILFIYASPLSEILEMAACMAGSEGFKGIGEGEEA